MTVDVEKLRHVRASLASVNVDDSRQVQNLTAALRQVVEALIPEESDS